MPSTATTAMSAICANARMPPATTLPASKARTGTAATRISTMRVCFSSVTLCAICRPKVCEVMKKTNAKTNGTRNATTGSTASGSSNCTGGEVLSAWTTSVGDSSIARTFGPETTAASTSPSRTACSAARSSATTRTSSPASRSGPAASWVTATVSGPPESSGGRMVPAAAISRKKRVPNRKVRSRSLTRISRSATSRVAWVTFTG